MGRKTPDTQSGRNSAWTLACVSLGCNHSTLTFLGDSGTSALSDWGPEVKRSEAAQQLWDGPWVLQEDLSKAQRLSAGMEWEASQFIHMLNPAHDSFSHCPGSLQ